MKARRWAQAGVFTAAAVGAVAWAVLGREEPVPEPAIDALAEYRTLVDRNAWGEDSTPLYARAVEIAQRINAEMSHEAAERVWLESSLDQLLHGSWDDPKLDSHKHVWARCDELVRAYTEAAQAGLAHGVMDWSQLALPPAERDDLIDAVFASRGAALRPADRVHQIRMRERQAINDGTGLVAAAADAMTLPRQVGAFSMVGFLIQISLEQGALREIRMLAMEGLNAPTAEALIALLGEHWPKIDRHFAAHLEGERMLWHDNVWRNRFVRSDAELREMLNAPHFAMFVDKADLRRYGRWSRRLDYARVWTAIDAHHEAYLENLKSSPVAVPLSPPSAEHPTLEPAIRISEQPQASIDSAFTMLRVQRNATIIALRLAAHRDRAGTWPKVLAEAMLDDETLDPVTAEVFLYELIDHEGGVRPSLKAPGKHWQYCFSAWPFGSADREFERLKEMLPTREPIYPADRFHEMFRDTPLPNRSSNKE